MVETWQSFSKTLWSIVDYTVVASGTVHKVCHYLFQVFIIIVPGNLFVLEIVALEQHWSKDITIRLRLTHPRPFWESNELYHISWLSNFSRWLSWNSARRITSNPVPVTFPRYLWHDVICYMFFPCFGTYCLYIVEHIVFHYVFSWIYLNMNLLDPFGWGRKTLLLRRKRLVSCGFGRIPWLHLVADAQEKMHPLKSQMQ